MGGCTRSSVLMQILADVVGCPVQVTHSAHVGMNCLWGGVHSKKCQVPRCTNRESSEPKTIHTTPSVKQKQKQTWPRKDNVRDPFHFQLGSTHPQMHFLQHPAPNTLEAYFRSPSPIRLLHFTIAVLLFFGTRGSQPPAFAFMRGCLSRSVGGQRHCWGGPAVVCRPRSAAIARGVAPSAPFPAR